MDYIMSKLKRKMIRASVGTMSPYDFDCTVTDIIERLQNLIDEYGDFVTLDYSGATSDWGDVDSGEYTIYIKRLETDKEYKQRCREHEWNKKQRSSLADAKLQKDRKEYERLKKLFKE